MVAVRISFLGFDAHSLFFCPLSFYLSRNVFHEKLACADVMIDMCPFFRFAVLGQRPVAIVTKCFYTSLCLNSLEK